ncbi:MAG: B12-binding domain-containing radical SAM protein [Candidatus Anammoxibacter sp.]
MNIEIISVWEPQYVGVKTSPTVSPLVAAYLAALLPSDVNVTIRHEQVRQVDYDIDVDLVAITFLTENAYHAYDIADRFRNREVTVIMGGFHASFLPEETLQHADAVVIGEAEDVFHEVITDFKRGSLKRIYKSEKYHSLKGLPTARYDLIEKEFVFNHTVQATRGCPYNCSFCSIKSIYKCFRMRPIDEVINDITCYEGRNYLQNKMVWFWDANLIGNKDYAKELFRRMIPLKKWWFTQASIDIVKDKELMRLAAESGCKAIFIGIETFSQENLENIKKHQNRIADYKKAIQTLHNYGIYVLAGLIVGLEEDTEESIKKIPGIIQEIGLDIIFINILTPNCGTLIHDQFTRDGRIITSDWSLYNGANTVFRPKHMSVEELDVAYLAVWQEIYSIPNSFKRAFKHLVRLRFNPFIWSAWDNGFFSALNLLTNYPFAINDGYGGTIVSDK